MQITLLCDCGHECAPLLAELCPVCGETVCRDCRATHPHLIAPRPEYPADDRCARCGEAHTDLRDCLFCGGYYCPRCRVDLVSVRPGCARCIAEARCEGTPGDTEAGIMAELARMVDAGEVKA